VDEDGKIRLTYPALADRAGRLAGALVVPAWATATVSYGSSEFVSDSGADLAAAAIGAIVCPANWAAIADELDFIIADAAPKADRLAGSGNRRTGASDAGVLRSCYRRVSPLLASPSRGGT